MQKKLYIIAALLILIFASLVTFFIWPLFIDIQNNSKNLASIKDTIASLQTQNNEIEHFNKIYFQYQPNLEAMTQSFIDPQNPTDVIKFLESAAQESGIDPKISLVANSGKQRPTMINFQIFLSGDFVKILQFTEKIENGPYAITIETITVNSADKDITVKNPPSGKVDANVLVHVFIKP